MLYEHLFVPGTPYTRSQQLSILDGALKRRDAELAWRTAGNISPQLELDRALLLVILLGEREAPAFQRSARRWLVRFIDEQRPTVDQVKRVADALNELLTFIAREDAREALENLAEQIRRRRS